MKIFKLLPGMGMLILGVAFPSFAQIELPEIEIVATNYKYLNQLGEEVSVPVRELQDKVADFDLQSTDFYQDEYQTYFVSFFIPEGRILASYDGQGNLLRTAEKFKNVNVPVAIKQAISKKYPDWVIARDVYRINYHSRSEKLKRRYKLILEKGDDRMRVKVNEQGEFI
jgi:hypothetical protein